MKDSDGQTYLVGDSLLPAVFAEAPDGFGTGKETAVRKGISMANNPAQVKFGSNISTRPVNQFFSVDSNNYPLNFKTYFPNYHLWINPIPLVPDFKCYGKIVSR